MKRLIWLGVCLVLLASLCLPVGARSFTDADKIKNPDAVAMMADLGLVNGYEDGSFLPRNNIRRSEAAKVAALICQQTPKATRTAAFSDVAPSFWAADFIAYCAEKGVIAGADGKFRPNDYVTGREFAKMLLACLGYEGSGYTGAQWAENVDRDAQKLGIYTGFTADPANYISRDDACLLMYNAMQCYAVVGKDASGAPAYALDELMNPMTYMEYRFHVVKYSGVLEANEYADLTEAGGRLEQGKSRLANHAAFDVSTPYEFLGRRVELYAIRTTIGTNNFYTVVGEPHLTDTEQVATVNNEESYLMALRYAAISEQSSTEYYLNGDRTSSDFMAVLEDDCHILVIDRDGDKKLDIVLATNYCQGTVTAAEPLTISSGDQTLAGGFFGEVRPLQPGDTVRCAAVGGRFCVLD